MPRFVGRFEQIDPNEKVFLDLQDVGERGETVLVLVNADGEVLEGGNLMAFTTNKAGRIVAERLPEVNREMVAVTEDGKIDTV